MKPTVFPSLLDCDLDLKRNLLFDPAFHKAQDMAQLNHSRPILKLLDAKKRGLAVSSLVKKYIPEASKSVSKVRTKVRQEAGDRQEMHEVAVAILDHIDKHGDYTDALRLIEFARNEPERDAIREWFTRYSKIGYDVRKRKFYFSRAKTSDRAGGIANPFWTLKPPPKRRPFDFACQLEKLVSKARAEQRAGNSSEDALLDDIEDAMRKHGIYPLKPRAGQ